MSARSRALRGRHVAARPRPTLPSPAAAAATAGAIALAVAPVSMTTPARASTLATTPAGVPQQVLPRVAAPVGMPKVTAALAVPAGLGAPEAAASYRPQVSCDPVAKPGVVAFRALVLSTFKVGGDDGIVRGCEAGGTSEHMEGRAWDWQVSASDPTQRAVADAFLDWLMAKGPDSSWGWQARRLGIMYVIWNGRIWASYSAAEGWRPYYGAVPHTDHVHFSFSWDGAMKRTSWWTGTPVISPDLGPCLTVAGQAAARWTAPTASCPAVLPAPVAVTAEARAKPRLGYGSRGTAVAALQQQLGVSPTGTFADQTEAALKAWQTAHHLYPSGVADPVTWTVLLAGGPGPAPAPAPAPGPAPAVPSLAALTLGAGNADVQALQSRLAALGWLTAAQATGTYDAGTRAAVAAFQRAQGWSGSGADGLMGPLTLSRLFSASASAAPAPTPAPAPVPTPVPAPAPAPAPAPTGTRPTLGQLGYGARNAGVTALQTRLAALGWLPAGTPTGVYDAATRSAVGAFQRAQGWRGGGADGLMGPATLARLFSATATRAPAGQTAPPPAADRVPPVSPRPSLAALRYGTASADVRLLQQRLVTLHRLSPGQAGGRYDEATRAAVAAFQREQGWRGSGADGLMGPLTLARLFA